MQPPASAHVSLVSIYLGRQRVFAVAVSLDGAVFGRTLKLPQHRVEHEVILS